MAGFQFKQFAISQQDCAMKVSTDGILLGAWAQVTPLQRVLDIGTGTGLLALMLKQREPSCEVYAIEIDEKAAACARFNIAQSPWQNIALYQQDINQFFEQDNFDLVISNPPYFVNSLPNTDNAKRLARHTGSLSFSQLIENWQRLGNKVSRLAVILPKNEAAQLQQLACQSGAYLWRECQVKTTPTKSVSRVLMEFGWQAQAAQRENLTIHNKSNDYSEAYKTLCRDFYLRF